MYMNMAQGMGGIDPLMDSFFGFLRRKTDFFSGAASEGAAQEQVIKAFKKNKERADEDVREKAAKEKKRKEEERKRKERIEAEKLAKQQARLRHCTRTHAHTHTNAASPRAPSSSCARAHACLHG